MSKRLKILLLVNAIFNVGGAMILLFFPDRMMHPFGAQLNPSTYFICYLLGASSLSMAVLSFYARKLNHLQSVSVIAVSCLVFHLTTALVGVYSFSQGLSSLVWVNVSIHFLFAFLFWAFGWRRHASA